ncbi:MAG: hypothetical protein M3O91_03185 [Chloroflexota bacterium]|nr:hypothetical protein [Chloroflexota bacterium]
MAAIRERTTIGATPVDVLGMTHPADEARRVMDDDDFALEFAAGRALSLEEATTAALRV